MLAGGGILALGVTATTLIASGIASSSGAAGFIGLPASGVPMAGAFGMAFYAKLMGAGDGTVATLIALGSTQLLGFSVLMGGVAGRKVDGIAPLCEGPKISFAPFISPTAGGIALRGSL